MRFTLPANLLLLVVLVLGCGSSSLDTVPVMGTITYQNKPLVGGTISFHPVDAAEGRPATARIENGRFNAATLQDAEGLVPGHYNVSVFYLERPLFDVSPAKASAVKAEIPSRYINPETSGLSLSVPKDSNGITYNIELID